MIPRQHGNKISYSALTKDTKSTEVDKYVLHARLSQQDVQNLG